MPREGGPGMGGGRGSQPVGGGSVSLEDKWGRLGKGEKGKGENSPSSSWRCLADGAARGGDQEFRGSLLFGDGIFLWRFAASGGQSREVRGPSSSKLSLRLSAWSGPGTSPCLPPPGLVPGRCSVDMLTALPSDFGERQRLEGAWPPLHGLCSVVLSASSRVLCCVPN